MSRGDGPSLPIDVRIPGVGRIKKRSGVRTAAERADLVAMLRLLPKQGHGELVDDIRAGRRTLLKVYRHFTEGTLAALHGPQNDELLEPTLQDWLEHALCAAGTRENRRAAFRALKTDGRRAYRFADLPVLLTALRERCEAAGTPRAFNIARTCVQAFLRDRLGKRKPLTLEVADIAQLRERKRGRPGLTIAEALAVRNALGAAAGAAWWSMVLTGMGPKEYWVDGWSVLDDRVHIAGAKVVRHGADGAFGRVRDVPLIETPVRPAIGRKGFESALRRLSLARLATELEGALGRAPTDAELRAAIARDPTGPWRVGPYQARKTFARWMEDARIPRVRREVYRGHGKRDIGDVYERYEVAAYLREDAQKLRDLLPQRGLRLEA